MRRVVEEHTSTVDRSTFRALAWTYQGIKSIKSSTLIELVLAVDQHTASALLI